jgi:hypothetical protein
LLFSVMVPVGAIGGFSAIPDVATFTIEDIGAMGTIMEGIGWIMEGVMGSIENTPDSITFFSQVYK